MLRLTFALCMFSGVLFAEGEPTPEALGKKFDAQVARLVERGYPELFGDRVIFDKEMAKLREKAVKYVPASPGYTFLIVIPENYAPLNWQIRQIILPTGEICGFATRYLMFREKLEIQNRDGFKAPRKPYLLFDVDDGASTVKCLAPDAVAEFKKAGRRGLTFEECTSFLVQRPELLGGAKVAATGTVIRYRDASQDTERLAYWQLNVAHPHNPQADFGPRDGFNVQNRGPFAGWCLTNCQLPSCGKERP